MTARASVPTIPIPLLRDGIAREAARYSLRRVAKEVGMSPNGLRDFLLGATPRTASRGKLERWLAEQGQVTRPPNVGQFIRLLNHLAVDLSPDQKTQFGRAIGQLLVESYETRRLAPPRWVQSLLRHYRPSGAKDVTEVA
jgi:transcriptional regulator with XRE-family HTH domain